MGTKRGSYRTEKQKLQDRCESKGIEYAARWGVKELREALAGKRKVAPQKSNTSRPLPPTVCLPAACPACREPIDPVEVAKHELRRNEDSYQATPTHHFDGVRYCRHECACGQMLVVKVPYRSRTVKCECGAPAVMWNSEGVGNCARCGKD